MNVDLATPHDRPKPPAGAGRLAIVSAMPGELAALRACLQGVRRERIAGRRFYLGRLAGHDVVLARSGIGKVAAATTTAVLLDRYAVGALLFTGVAGGLGAGVTVGDAVIGERFIQHDMNAAPLFARWQVPGFEQIAFAAHAGLSAVLARAAEAVLAAEHPALAALGIRQPKMHRGLIISGDQFIASGQAGQRLRAEHPQALAVEMEGAAVAQVCTDFERPFAVLRTISDCADDAAPVDFSRFLAEVAAPFARDIVLAALADPDWRAAGASASGKP